ncbi:hypothetical protein Bbelb_062690 [Branchiostoma belcheri]|nr:hypothetical protein Bbelb_062690 [Branchiostoma belcheri]
MPDDKYASSSDQSSVSAQGFLFADGRFAFGRSLRPRCSPPLVRLVCRRGLQAKTTGGILSNGSRTTIKVCGKATPVRFDGKKSPSGKQTDTVLVFVVSGSAGLQEGATGPKLLVESSCGARICDSVDQGHR